MPLVVGIARRMANLLPDHLDVNDFISDGAIGLLDAIDKYDDSFGVPFQSYIRLRIRGAIIDGLRDMDQVPRSMRAFEKSIQCIRRKVEQGIQRPAESHEMAEALGLTLDEYFQEIAAHMPPTILGESKLQSVQFEEFVGFRPDVLENMIRAETFKELVDLINQLSHKERQVIQWMYFENQLLRVIAEKMGYTESRISLLHRSALKKLQRALLHNQVVESTSVRSWKWEKDELKELCRLVDTGLTKREVAQKLNQRWGNHRSRESCRIKYNVIKSAQKKGV
jgi:RNA polymerase sigma factor for flagellar operon FliA